MCDDEDEQTQGLLHAKRILRHELHSGPIQCFHAQIWLGGGSINKVCSTQTRGPEFVPQNP